MRNISLEKSGIYIGERDRPNFTIDALLGSFRLDETRNFLLARNERQEQYVFSLDGIYSTIFPYNELIEAVTLDKNIWKIKTNNSLYEKISDIWRENPRFTDYTDLSSRYRIGYIDATDSEKLSLGNFPLGISVFVLIDRTSTDMRIIKK
jgi:hypothetical protein